MTEKYTKKATGLQYKPSDVKPEFYEMVGVTKTLELTESINSSNLNDEEKYFLSLCAYRHLKFNYAKIADYYAHSNQEIKDLMVKSGLVIVDVNDAVALGYAKLTKELEDVYKQEHE